MNEIEDTIRKAQDEALNKLRLGAVSGSYYPMLLMASYCGGENPKCTDELPCEDCLKMSNIVLIPKDQVKSENEIGNDLDTSLNSSVNQKSKRNSHEEAQVL